MSHTIWLGPVFAQQVQAAVLPESTLHVVQVSDQAQAAPILASWKDADGNYVPKMLSQLGIPPGATILLASFSAGHDLAAYLTLSLADRALFAALLLADSAQSSWADQARTLGNVPAGYLAFAQEAAAGQRVMVASDSTFSASSYASSSQTMANLAAQLALPAVDASSASSPPPLSAVGAGELLLLDYGQQVSHSEHATALAAQLVSNVVVPWLAAPPATPEEQPPNPPGAPSRLGWGLAALAGLGLGAYLLSRPRRTR